MIRTSRGGFDGRELEKDSKRQNRARQSETDERYSMDRTEWDEM